MWLPDVSFMFSKAADHSVNAVRHSIEVRVKTYNIENEEVLRLIVCAKLVGQAIR